MTDDQFRIFMDKLDELITVTKRCDSSSDVSTIQSDVDTIQRDISEIKNLLSTKLHE
jgi:hypothetical protein